jgi:hypothetical protein
MGTTPAQALSATSSAGSVGQPSEIFSDQSWIGMASTIVAASSARRGPRISATRPGRKRSVITSSAGGRSGPASRVNVPNSTALRYRNELSKLDRATMMPFRSVTATQTGRPAAARRSHPDPVEP